MPEEKDKRRFERTKRDGDPLPEKKKQKQPPEEYPPLPERCEVVPVRFRDESKVYYFAPNGSRPVPGDHVIVETARGLEYGEVAFEPLVVSSDNVVPPLRNVVRIATEADARKVEENRKKEADALVVCQQKIEAHKLEMKLISAEYTFDNSKILFYFTADGRVDFRELVKDLASVFHTRIELRQIGIRDEAKCLGGIGVCGRPFCCRTFLPDFAQVSIKMAKEQNLSLNSAKISGTCGRLMCCLRFESEAYAAEIRLTPRVDSLVETPDGKGRVVETAPLTGMVKVRLDAAPDAPPKAFHRDVLTLIEGPKKGGRSERSDKSGQEEGPEDGDLPEEDDASAEILAK